MVYFTLLLSGYMFSSLSPVEHPFVTPKLDCAKVCMSNPNCSSLFFNTLTRNCQLDRYVYTGSNNRYTENSVLYYTVRHEACPVDYTYCRSTRQCLKQYDIVKSFQDAKVVCETDSGHLVYPKTLEKNTQVTLMKRGGDIWIGAKETSPSVWKWLDGQTLGPYTCWMPGKPDGKEAIYVNSHGRWQDDYYSARNRYICQIDVNDVSIQCCQPVPYVLSTTPPQE